MARVIIIGAGISGLALAWRLRQLDPAIDITILEEHNRPGGPVWTLRESGYLVECGPNGFLSNKPHALQLCRDIGLADQLIAASPEASRKRYLFYRGALHALPASAGQLLRSGLLSWRGKLNFFAERFRRRRTDEQDESVAEFTRRRAGGEVASIFADALVTGIYAGDPKLLSAKASFPRLWEMERQYGSLLKGFDAVASQRRTAPAGAAPSVEFWSLRRGMGSLIETLADKLGPVLVKGVRVKRLERMPGSDRSPWLVHGKGAGSWRADVVVLTCPAYGQAEILGELDADLARQIEAVPYNRVAVIALGFRQDQLPAPLSGFGYISPQSSGRDVLGVQWCSSIFPDRAPAGHVLLRAMMGGWHRPEIVGWEDGRLLEALRAELKITMGIQSPAVFHSIVRWRRAIPQYLVRHFDRVEQIEARAAAYPGLFLGGNAYRGVALNDCIEAGQRLAAQIARHLDT